MKSGKTWLLTALLTAAFAITAAVPAFAEVQNPCDLAADGDVQVQQIPTILPPL